MSGQDTMRIIAGRWRSRRILCPEGRQTRPIPDRVKEAVFDLLGSRYGTPGGLPPLVIADVFSGSGAVGLEALSRGAAACHFIESHPLALKALRANLHALDVGPCARIMALDAWKDPWTRLAGSDPLDLLLLDPPYRDSADASPTGKVARLLGEAAESERLHPGALAVLHHEVGIQYEADAVPGWEPIDHRVYGRNVIVVFRRLGTDRTG
jgi:16S rRNA (guanine966-N2)-methyltransferase